MRRQRLQLHRARGPGRRSGGAVVDRCLTLAIISTLVLLALVYICHCAYNYSSIDKATKQKKFMKKTALPKVVRSA